MTDNRWAWVPGERGDITDVAEVADSADVAEFPDGSEQKLHINTAAGIEALDLWNPQPADVPDLSADTDLSSDTPGPSGAPIVGDAAHGGLTEAEPDARTVLVADGDRGAAGRRTWRRAAIVAGVVAVAATVVGVVAALVWPSESSPAAGPPAPVGAWCRVGVSGEVTTVAAGGGGVDSPQRAVAALVSALLDQRSPAAARAVMAASAPAPTLDELRTWIAGLPAEQVSWCARITATDSPARLRVVVTGRVGDHGDPQPMSSDTFYVSAPTPTTWVVDAIVAEEGTQP
ncbi:hypothetical protein [Gordonia rhizosphera]|uniref:DUF8176 domain-containing protein n=1 Tax=Gordonia rhizosphera NBRC 16068 TaxID=1108045 RepID=K6VXG4_9ACTN|nr:hypothetical protein [Gordonia rhizosphera]GAB91615.1 hypothetical protein GORHZ_139_00070 [Gordonia rhizosphera NBRC 16068]